MPEGHRHLGRDTREDRDDRGIACQPWLGLDQELVKREAVGELNPGEDIADPRETLGASGRGNIRQTKSLIDELTAKV